MVEANLTEPDVLDYSIGALGERLPRRRSCPGWPSRRRPSSGSPRLQGALAAGFARALRDRTFAQQERIGRSAWAARNDVEQALRDSEARFRAVFSSAATGIGIADTDGQILDVNRAFADLLGYAVEEMRTMNVAQLFHPDDAAGMWELYTELISGVRDSVRLEKRYYRKDGTPVWTDLSVSLVRHDDGRPRFTVAMVQDITEQYGLQERLQFQALHDPLTGLPNRTLFFERLAATLADAGPDAPGRRLLPRPRRLQGDQRHASATTSATGCWSSSRAASARPPAHLVARMGGDEFVILVEDCAGTERGDRGRRERAGRRRRAGAGRRATSSRCPASVGVVERPVAGATASRPHEGRRRHALLGQGRGGRGRWALHDPARAERELATLGARRRAAGARWRGASSRSSTSRSSALSDGVVRGGRGAGALAAPHARAARARPVHPAGRGDRAHRAAGPVGAGDRVRRGQPVARRVPAGPADRQRQPRRARRSHDPDIVDVVADVLAAPGCPPDLLQLELTESAVIATIGEPVRSLRRLAATGVRLAIDDFGTGYSNLAYLRQLPIQALKLAGPFVTDIRDDDPSGLVAERVVDALVRLTHALGLSVTAESVETRAPGRTAAGPRLRRGAGPALRLPGRGVGHHHPPTGDRRGPDRVIRRRRTSAGAGWCATEGRPAYSRGGRDWRHGDGIDHRGARRGCRPPGHPRLVGAPMSEANLLPGGPVADEILADVSRRVAALRARGTVPGLATILVGDDDASAGYIRIKQREAARLGFESRTRTCPRTPPRTTSSAWCGLQRRPGRPRRC